MFDDAARGGVVAEDAQRSADLLESFLTMREIRAGYGLEVRMIGTVARQHGVTGSQIEQAPQRTEVVPEVTVCVVEDGGTAAEDGVGGENTAIVLEHEGQRIRGVAGGREHPDPQPGDLDDLTVLESPTPTVPVRRVDGADGIAGQFREMTRTFGVVDVPVADQRQRDRDLRNAGEMSLVERTRVHHDAFVAAGRPQDPRVRAL